MDLVLHAPRAVLPSGEASVTVGVDGGRIAAVEPLGTPMPARRELRLADDEVLLPGLVDAHVHVNDPGRSEWEGFDTATRAAAAGGVTTLVDMPLNSIPPTVDVASLQVKRQAAEGRVHVDVGFWGGAVPHNLADLEPLLAAGVVGFKCFLLPSGVDEFPELSPVELERALREVHRLGATMIVHAEDAESIADTPASTRYADFLHSRPRAAEDSAIERLIALSRSTGARVHVVHLSSSDALPAVAAARADGVPLTVETCPHYLTFAAEDVPDGATQFKCCPPIREAANRELLWQALSDGVIDDVVSDHSPCTPELKRLDSGDFAAAWGGISGLQLGLPAVWSGARQRGIPLTDVVRWMAERPAARTGLHQKGRLAVGADADLCVFAPEAEFTVEAAALAHRNPVSAYDGERLHGVVRSTWLRGTEVDGVRARGELLKGGFPQQAGLGKV